MSWLVVHTKPQAEAVAARNLVQQGHNVFLPQCFLDGALRPLFPRYLFLKVAHCARSVRSTMGVNSLVLAPGGEPAVMDDTEVDLLRSAPPIKIERIRRGDVVRVTEGPLYGHQGICSAAGDERVSVLFALLGRTTTVQLATASVECV